jgi:hypothetical protein
METNQGPHVSRTRVRRDQEYGPRAPMAATVRRASQTTGSWTRLLARSPGRARLRMGMVGGSSAGFRPRRRFPFYPFLLCFAFLSPFQNLLFEFKFVVEFHTQIKCTNKSANMKKYIYSYIFFLIVYILFLFFPFLSSFVFKF